MERQNQANDQGSTAPKKRETSLCVFLCVRVRAGFAAPKYFFGYIMKFGFFCRFDGARRAVFGHGRPITPSWKDKSRRRAKRPQLFNWLQDLHKGVGALITPFGGLMERSFLKGSSLSPFEGVAPRLGVLASVDLALWDTTEVTEAGHQRFCDRCIRAVCATPCSHISQKDAFGTIELCQQKKGS